MGYNDGSNGIRAYGCLKIPKAYEPINLKEMHAVSKLDVHDWLSDITLPTNKKAFNIVEVRFKNGRKGFFAKPEEMILETGDLVAVEANPGHDIGLVNLTGDLVKIQMKKARIREDSEQIKQIYRRARATDIEKWEAAIEQEEKTLLKARSIVNRLTLEMKINDVEYQGDGTKAIFYYTAEGRVDFRQLIKDLAREFNIRIEMKQIGARQESAKLGGLSSCGRELCCATWLQDFKSVSTNVAREQQLSLNPQKLAGQCGKLKCCLNYEYDVYVDALKKFPESATSLQTKKGKAFAQKKDIFKETIWFAYDDNEANLIPLDLKNVKIIKELNDKGETPESLEEFLSSTGSESKEGFHKVDEQDDIKRFDKEPNKDKKKRKKREHSGSHYKTPKPKNLKNKAGRPHSQGSADKNKNDKQ